jgi:UDP-N-acetylmuramoyl-L-alanyl-D-glutamate--2,6-diaminopimelate ligase
MLTTIKNFIRSIIPKSIFRSLQPAYHGTIARIAAIYFGNPGKKLFVIGITGTAGKSTTVMMLSQILNFADNKTGYITTTGFYNGTTTFINKHGLSMPGGWLLHKQLAEMVKNNCKTAIVECTSEGLVQKRHLGINFRVALFTNLSPAHLDSHGSFENYRSAKGLLFAALGNTKAETMIGVNFDDPNKNYFLDFPASRKFGVSMRSDITAPSNLLLVRAENIEVNEEISFTVEEVTFNLKMFGTFNITNALLAIACAKFLGVTLETAAEGLRNLNTVPGRLEEIKMPNGAKVVVDYAPEPSAMKASLEAVNALAHQKIIHVFGSTGGHRDVAKRFEFGKISAANADTIIITNDDVYDSDPQEIADNVREGINQAANKKVQTIETILDRTDAIKRALQIAEPTDIILITGKGSEQFLVLPNNERIEWDEREVVKNLIKTL